jgi:hypothetical protein
LISAVFGDSETERARYKKYEVAAALTVKPAYLVTLNEMMEGKKQTTANYKAAINRMAGLNNTQRAVLYALIIGRSSAPRNNPYSVTAAARVWGEMGWKESK